MDMFLCERSIDHLWEITQMREEKETWIGLLDSNSFHVLFHSLDLRRVYRIGYKLINGIQSLTRSMLDTIQRGLGSWRQHMVNPFIGKRKGVMV